MNAFEFLAPFRPEKPRTNGITMVLDKGLGLETAADLMEISGNYVDFLKFGWGTISIHNKEIIQNKIDMYQSYGVDAYPGGTLFELAHVQKKIPEYFEEASSLGFKALEISDGSIDLPLEKRLSYISEAKDKGFKVISEVGKKDPEKDLKITLEDRINLIKMDLEAGSNNVIIEARESGQNIGIFDKNGNVKEDEVDYLLNNLPSEKLIWEAPQKSQQVYFILKIGSEVNLGNIPPEEITSLETMRRGLRGDTLGKVNL